VRGKNDIAAMVRAVAPKPLNVVMMRPGLSVAELADLGVRRISIGGAVFDSLSAYSGTGA
jgi:2-methylisocitrate lyase-like PEP mutase family enzyme